MDKGIMTMGSIPATSTIVYMNIPYSAPYSVEIKPDSTNAGR